jgi:dihydroxyacetone kinase
MPFLLNNPEEFVDQATEGFIAANGHLVRQVHGGVVRNQEKQAGQVAVVIGGGSGHYPAFAGVVGPGLAHGAVMGNVFASPSAQRVLSVCKSVEAGAGVLLSYGNYAGDVMNFNLAQEELIAEGIPCKTVLVTDDIMSADKSEIHKRRGIAGDLVVFKIAAAAAEAGYSLDEVYKVGERANERTRTIGVAFSGCTLPGKNEPLFTVPEGRMALGLGIHGEPGLSESDIPTSKDLANDLVERLINETPASVDSQFPIRLTVLVNGLGGVKYEELFIFYRDVSENLRKRGIEIVEPEVGELVTSFEMAGASLTFTWLDNELEELWKKPAYTAAYKKGTLTFKTQVINQKSSELAEAKIVPGTAESQQCAKTIARILEKIDIKCREVSEELGKLDAIAGDGDHGIGMTKGAHAAALAASRHANQGAGAGATLLAASDAWSDNAGGTSGIIWGIILKEFGSAFGDQTSPKIETINNAIGQATRAVTSFGKAQLGDKTLVDVLIPFSKKFEELSRESSTQDISLSKIWQDASDTARNAANATANLVPKIGRARPHAEKSVGHSDPGAESLAIIIAEISSFFTDNHHG